MLIALDRALLLASYNPGATADNVVSDAEVFHRLLLGEVPGRVGTSLTVTPGNVVEQGEAVETVQMTDTQQVDLAVSEADSKGVPLQDTLTWTVDNATSVSLVVSTDTQTCTCVAGLPGSAVVTVTDGLLSATQAIDVVPSAVATINVTPGTPTDQPPPPPPLPVI